MKKSRFSEEQIIGIMREADSGRSVKVVCAQHNLSAATYYAWKCKYGGMEVNEAPRLRALEEEELALETVGGRSMCADSNPEGGELKKVVGPSQKRRAVKQVIETGIGTAAEACRALGLARSSYYRNRMMSNESRNLQKQIVHLSQDHPRYGYRRVTALLRRQGNEISGKRVQRARREEGLQVSRKPRKLRPLGVSSLVFTFLIRVPSISQCKNW